MNNTFSIESKFKNLKVNVLDYGFYKRSGNNNKIKVIITIYKRVSRSKEWTKINTITLPRGFIYKIAKRMFEKDKELGHTRCPICRIDKKKLLEKLEII